MGWIFDGSPVTEDDLTDSYGFVYIITNMKSGRKYLGKKFLFARKTKQVKGKKKRYLAESDWKEYWGSNQELLKDIKELGVDCFQKAILKFCKSKGECSYWEAAFQFQYGVLLSEEDWYNTWIMVRVRKNHLNVKPKTG